MFFYFTETFILYNFTYEFCIAIKSLRHSLTHNIYECVFVSVCEKERFKNMLFYYLFRIRLN